MCSDGEWKKWRVLTDTLSTADDLLACVSKREGNTAFVTEENALYECVDGGWEKIVTYMKTVSSQEELSNCASKNEGDSSYVSSENTVYLCISESWRELGEFGTVSDSLPNCTEKREGERVFLSEEHVTLICNANKWKHYDIFSAVEEEENSEPKSSSSENEWEDYEPVEQCEEKKLSKGCLKGKWTVSTLDGASTSFAGAGILKFSGSTFTYTPQAADLKYTYCPGTELEGTYDIISLTQIKLTVGGIRLYDCFIGKKEIIVNATISENELRLSGIEESPFVPNDEGLKTEIYNRTEDSSSNAEESTSSSSVDAACTEVVATEVTLSNILETDQYAINLVTGLAENPHLTLEIVDNMAYFQAAPGVEIWEEETQDFGLLPEAPVCLESFKTVFGSQTNRLELMGNMWLYIKTPEGYFPMMLGKVKYQDEKTGSIIITYYK